MLDNNTSVKIPEALKAYRKPRLDIHETAHVCCTTPSQIRKEICTKGHFLGMKSIKIGVKHTFAIEDIAKMMQG